MSKKVREREKLYQIYNRNLQLVVGAMKYDLCKMVDGEPIKTDDGYLCPLCINFFCVDDLDQNRSNPLTLEHIEPDSIGGKRVVLTCKDCNNDTGRLIDKALKIHTDHNADNIANARFTLDDLSLKGKFMFDSNQNTVDSVFNKSNDYIKRKIEDFFKGGGEKEIKFEVPFENEKRFICALLKVAHLKMFELFGFGYLMNTSVYKIAHQIKKPNEDLIKSIGYMVLPEQLPENESIFFGETKNTKFFLVKVILRGNKKNLRYGVFIPGPKESDLSLFQKIKEYDGIKFQVSSIENRGINYLDNPYSYYDFFK